MNNYIHIMFVMPPCFLYLWLFKKAYHSIMKFLLVEVFYG
ncbi:MAG: hypothetical protein RIS29_2867 [Bacteroidota bacterium]|jgi:hypothetical protein